MCCRDELEYYIVGRSRSRVANRIHRLDGGSVIERGYDVFKYRLWGKAGGRSASDNV